MPWSRVGVGGGHAARVLALVLCVATEAACKRSPQAGGGPDASPDAAAGADTAAPADRPASDTSAARDLAAEPASDSGAPDGAPTDRAGAGGPDGPAGIPWPEAPGYCNAKWCWSNPLPQGNGITSMCGFSASDVWAVGSGGTLLHWDGTRWSLVPTGTSVDLRDVWCSPQH